MKGLDTMLKDGYYLFIYSEINPVLHCLGLSLRHDHNLAVFLKKDEKITLKCHLEFERFTGKKHHNIAFFDSTDASLFINQLLSPYQLKLEDFVGIYGMPGLVSDDDNLSYTSINELENISYHAVSHLFTSLILNSNQFYNNDIIALAFDGGPDNLIDKDVDRKNYFCGAFSQKGRIKYFPISSPGAYWLYLKNYFNMQEGTLMALAYATTAQSLECFETLPPCYGANDKNHMADAIDLIIKRIMQYTIADIGTLYVNHDDRFSVLENKISMIVKVIQELSINNVFDQINQIIHAFSINPNETMIALSGGYALNCPTNTRIMEKYHFKQQLCAPCLNDGGLAIGMGLYFFYKNCDRFIYNYENAFYGYNDKQNFEKTLFNYSNYIESVDKGIERAAHDILQAPIVWFNGNAESGPRALGHRSLLANPMNILHKNLLNQYKQREWWRPVAPIILESDLDQWFINSFLSPYMLNNFQIKKKLKNKVPAILHLDESARIQSINCSDDPDLYAVVHEFKSLTGIPIVCNTSLNDRSEPIINTIEQAINFALRKKIKIIYAYGNRICLKNHNVYSEKSFLKRDDTLFKNHVEQQSEVLQKANPYQISNLDFLIYIFNPILYKYDITKKDDVDKLKRILCKIKKHTKDLKVLELFSQQR